MMPNRITRKSFIKSSSLAVSYYLMKPPFTILHGPTLKAVAFDGLALFDPRPAFRRVIELYPENGKQIVDLWQSKQFAYQWLRACGQRYRNFREVTRDALDLAFDTFGVRAPEAQREEIMEGFDRLNAWPDVPAGLQALKEQGLRISVLSNMTEEMLQRGIRHSGLNAYFDQVISTDSIQSYKPAPVAYQLGVNRLKMKKEEILFVPFAGWDMAGAKWYGYPTYWVNRLGAQEDRLDAVSDGTGTDFSGLAPFVKKRNSASGL